ncbi:hypothetical protein SAMN05216570_3458 [Dyella sp. OK004]|nr:hypothetical protein SAMN05216570_3458 [Dyella sp. OK004]
MLRFKARQTIKSKNTIPTPDTGKSVATKRAACSSGHFSLVTFSLGQQRESDPSRGSGSEARGRRARTRRRDSQAITPLDDQLRCCEAPPAFAGMTK